jgi:hypothetical protein
VASGRELVAAAGGGGGEERLDASYGVYMRDERCSGMFGSLLGHRNVCRAGQ